MEMNGKRGVLPCPFCGEVEGLVLWDYDALFDREYTVCVSCARCHLFGPVASKDLEATASLQDLRNLATQRWNRRVALGPQKHPLDERKWWHRLLLARADPRRPA